MPYIRYTPSPPLDAFIEAFYYFDRPMPYPREKILPTPLSNLMINFGGALQGCLSDQSAPFATCAESWSVGLWNTYHVVRWNHDMCLLMVDFKPGGAYPFLDLPISELHNQVVPLNALWGGFASEVRERLYALPTPHARFKLLEALLLARLRAAPDGFRAVRHAVAQINCHRGALSIRALSDHIGMSQKHLIDQFKRLVGTTPKELSRMTRFWHVLYTIDFARPVNWTTVAHHALYYDQSHFNKDFEAFTGHTPTSYLDLRRRIHAEHPDYIHYHRQLPIG